MKANYYGVAQMDYGHEYRWIFDRDSLAREFEKYKINVDVDKLDYVDICFPIGGSNSSSTLFCPLDTEEDAIEFLKKIAEGPDLDDPELTDIAEYSLTIDTDDEEFGACTRKILDKFNINADDLEQLDDECKHYENSVKMINALKEAGYKDFDYDDPFYGENGSMTYYELCDLYEEICEVKV